MFRFLAIVAALIVTMAVASAAEPQFPVGSRIGLVPPPGLQLRGNAPGFIDADKRVAMMLLQLPPGAYWQAQQSMTTDAAKKNGITVDRREILFTDIGTGMVSVGNTSDGGRKWLVAIPTGGFTALITVEIPEDARDAYPDEAIRTAVQTVALRQPPLAEILKLLPYSVDNTSGFRVVRVMAGSAMLLTDGPKDEIHASEQPLVLIGIARETPARPEERQNFAVSTFANLPGFIGKRITSAEPMRIGGQPGFEIRGEAKDATTNGEVRIVQWQRFVRGAVLHVVAATAPDSWRRDFPRFREIRDAIELR